MMRKKTILTLVLVTVVFAFFTAAQGSEKTKKKSRSKGAAGETTSPQGTPNQGPPAAGPPPAPSLKPRKTKRPGKAEEPRRVGTLGDLRRDLTI